MIKRLMEIRKDKLARRVNEVNRLYLIGDKTKADKLKRKLRRVRDLDTLIFRAWYMRQEFGEK